jgi:sugar lactone lactonase YvrE
MHLQPPVGRLELPGAGPEDIVVDQDGRLLVGVADGRILRVARDGRLIERIADTGGRPLGLEALPGGGLLICDESRGLLHLAAGSSVPEVLVDRIDGKQLTFCSNVVASSDGTIYFTVSSQRYRLAEYRLDLIEHSGTGLLVRRSPDGTVQVLLDNLQFANGLALSDDESFLLFAETAGYSLSRYDLSGATQGRRTVLARNLPGFPDNLSRGTGGITWVTLASPRDPVLDLLLRRAPLLRRVLGRIPEKWPPGPKRTSWVLGIDDHGRIAADLQAPGENYSFVTGVVEVDGVLYLGSLLERAIGVLPLPAASRPRRDGGPELNRRVSAASSR